MYSSVTNNYILYTLFGLSGSLFIFGVCRNFIVKNAFLEYIGMNTTTILAIHEPIKRVVLKISEITCSHIGFDWSIDYIQNNILFGFIISCIVLFSTIPIIKTLHYVKLKTGKIGSYILNFVK